MKSELGILIVIGLLMISGCIEKTKPTIIDESKLFKEWENNCSNFTDGIINRTLLPHEVIMFEVRLRSRPHSVPPPGIDCELLQILKQPTDDFLYVAMQFDPQIGSAEDREKYRDLGIQLEGTIGFGGWVVIIPADLVYINDLIKNHNVRWVGPTTIEDKVSQYILDDQYKKRSWAVNEDGTIDVIVVFSENVSETDALETIKTHKGELLDTQESLSGYTIKILRDNVLEMVKNYKVKWVEFVSPPAVPNVVASPIEVVD